MKFLHKIGEKIHWHVSLEEGTSIFVVILLLGFVAMLLNAMKKTTCRPKQNSLMGWFRVDFF